MPLIEGLEITTLAAEGKAMGHHEGVVIFVPMTIPGDVVDVQITKRHRRFMEGRVVRFQHKSENRVEPVCWHFGVCGGCKWQNLPYQTQLDYKTQQVCDQLVRIGKLDIPEVRPCLGSEEQLYYRNKIEYTFADRRWLTYEASFFKKKASLAIHYFRFFACSRAAAAISASCWGVASPGLAARVRGRLQS